MLESAYQQGRADEDNGSGCHEGDTEDRAAYRQLYRWKEADDECKGHCDKANTGNNPHSNISVWNSIAAWKVGLRVAEPNGRGDRHHRKRENRNVSTGCRCHDSDTL